jgi:hypothetical protein
LVTVTSSIVALDASHLIEWHSNAPWVPTRDLQASRRPDPDGDPRLEPREGWHGPVGHSTVARRREVPTVCMGAYWDD